MIEVSADQACIPVVNRKPAPIRRLTAPRPKREASPLHCNSLPPAMAKLMPKAEIGSLTCIKVCRNRQGNVSILNSLPERAFATSWARWASLPP